MPYKHEESPPEPEEKAPASDKRQRRRGLWLGDLLVGAVGAAQREGLTPFLLAFVILAPAALVATAIEYWLDFPGALLVVVLTMSAFALYVAAVMPLLVDKEAAARSRSLAALIDNADARMPSLALAGGAMGFVVAAGLELRLLPGFLVLGLLALTAPAIVREKLGPFAGLRRSLRYSQGNAVAFALLGAIVGAAALGIYAFFAFVLEPLPLFFAELIAVAAAGTLAAPVATHAFVLAFDGRVAGRRLAVRPSTHAGSTRAVTTGRAAMSRTIAGLSEQRAKQLPRVSFTARGRTESSRLRYSPDAATMTLRVRRPQPSDMAAPDWAQTEENPVGDELHTAV